MSHRVLTRESRNAALSMNQNRFEERYRDTPAILAGYSMGGDAAIRAGRTSDGSRWDLRIVLGARVDDADFVGLIEKAAANSEAVIILGIIGDNEMANDQGLEWLGGFFGDRSHEGIVASIEAVYGTMEAFYDAHPNVVVEAAPRTPHGGGGEAPSTIDAVEVGLGELVGRGVLESTALAEPPVIRGSE